MVKIIIAIISAATGSPAYPVGFGARRVIKHARRITLEKESIQARQVQYAEPRIVRKVINRLIYAGVLPMPENAAVTQSNGHLSLSQRKLNRPRLTSSEHRSSRSFHPPVRQTPT